MKTKFKVGDKVKFKSNVFSKEWRHRFDFARRSDQGKVIEAFLSASRVKWNRKTSELPDMWANDWLTKA